MMNKRMHLAFLRSHKEELKKHEEEEKWYHIELRLTEKEKDKLADYCYKRFGLWMCKEVKR